MIGLLFSPIWSEEGKVDEQEEKMEFNSYALSKVENGKKEIQQNTIYMSIIAFVVGALAGYEIFSYKNRIRQRMLGGVNSLIMILLIGIAFYITYTADQAFHPEQQGKYQIGFFLIMIAIILNIIANRFIMRDEKLVKSADRMR
jgi:hypothetical protein